MNKNQQTAFFLLFAASMLILACRSGQLLSPTDTPVPAATFTAMPTLTETPTVIPTPTPISYDGQWSGTTAQGMDVSFTIVDNAVTEISIQAKLQGSNCTSEVKTTGTFTNALPIENDTFTAGEGSANPAYTFSGTFTGADSIAGILKYENVINCPASVEVDWSATRGSGSSSSPVSIAGIDEPIVVNNVNVQVLETKWEEPNVATGFQLKSGYRSLMITMRLQSDETNSAAELMNALSFREIAVVDDNDNESPIIFFNLPISSLTGSEYAQLDLYFAVLENTTPKNIRFVDGQVIDLVSLLPH